MLTDTSSDEKSFDWAFEEFLRKNTYTGGAVAATKDGKLIIARGYGTDQDGNEVRQFGLLLIFLLASQPTIALDCQFLVL